MVNQVIYPAVFHFDDDGTSVLFPDLPGCITCGNNEKEAVEMAKEAMGLHLYSMEIDGEDFPTPSSIRDIKTDKNEAVCLISVYMDAFRDERNRKLKKKTLTIPLWIDEIAIDKGVNVSKVLERALKDYMGL
ncbi:type II toxin-antitoxin system HicB family antitoxin [Bacillus velezensis]|uniref:type II toxin-antitoxin system HicB family antitoxin n=1 Tax=Bacillus velezensis TaxID=492670 RepID=UPI0018C4A766|nr:type II toxin-antitoxin system HicB family antitoxin [Bacillus velezensis]QPK89788.1 type II toxin-antitoxin system HicB family antitoxin [Bacillus velezensis]